MAVSRRGVPDGELEQRAAGLLPGQRLRLRLLVDELHERRRFLSASAALSEKEPVEYLVWPEYTESANELFLMLSRFGLVVPFDWSGWAQAVSLRVEAPPMEFSVADAVRYVTYVVRSDPSAINTFGTSIINGSLLAAVEAIVAHEG